jgi:hypothetical protein
MWIGICSSHETCSISSSTWFISQGGNFTLCGNNTIAGWANSLSASEDGTLDYAFFSIYMELTNAGQGTYLVRRDQGLQHTYFFQFLSYTHSPYTARVTMQNVCKTSWTFCFSTSDSYSSREWSLGYSKRYVYIEYMNICTY